MSDDNEETPLDPTGLYRRAIACLLGSTDPLTDMSRADKDRVLAIIGELQQDHTGEHVRTLKEIFGLSEEVIDAFYVCYGEQWQAMHGFLEALAAEVEPMWRYFQSDPDRRAIACLLGDADPSDDMSARDEHMVLGLITALQRKDPDGQQAILDDFFEGRLDDGRRFEAAVRAADKRGEDRETFLAALPDQASRIREFVRGRGGIRHRAADARGPTVRGGGGR